MSWEFRVISGGMSNFRCVVEDNIGGIRFRYSGEMSESKSTFCSNFKIFASRGYLGHFSAWCKGYFCRITSFIYTYIYIFKSMSVDKPGLN